MAGNQKREPVAVGPCPDTDLGRERADAVVEALTVTAVYGKYVVRAHATQTETEPIIFASFVRKNSSAAAAALPETGDCNNSKIW